MVETGLTTIIGIIGAGIILIVFLLNQFDRLKNYSLLYDLGNLIGSIFLIIYALLLSSYPFLILNTVWGLVSLKDVIKYLMNRNQIKKIINQVENFGTFSNLK